MSLVKRLPLADSLRQFGFRCGPGQLGSSFTILDGLFELAHFGLRGSENVQGLGRPHFGCFHDSQSQPQGLGAGSVLGIWIGG